MRSRYSCVVVLSIVLGVLSLKPSAAQNELQVVLQAVAAEEKVPRKRASLTVRRGTSETHYRIERVLPDRLRMHWRRDARDQEFIVIGKKMFSREGGGAWSTTPTTPGIDVPISVAKLFENGLEDLREQSTVVQDGVVQRVFTGRISWLAGRTRNYGEFRIAIERDSTLPRRLNFKGLCGTTECSFEHLIVYDPSITIEPPI
jgi:hypothetical protein